jgi:hypothetical protein
VGLAEVFVLKVLCNEDCPMGPLLTLYQILASSLVTCECQETLGDFRDPEHFDYLKFTHILRSNYVETELNLIMSTSFPVRFCGL